MRTVIKPGVGGIFGRTSSIGALVEGAALRYSADQRPKPVLGSFGDWAPGQPVPDMPTVLAHGYYGVGPDGVVMCSGSAPEWDCNLPNSQILGVYGVAAVEAGIIPNAGAEALIEAVRAGRLPPPPGFPPLAMAASLTDQPPTALLQTAAPASNLGLFIGLGVAALALGSAVVVKKKRAA